MWIFASRPTQCDRFILRSNMLRPCQNSVERSLSFLPHLSIYGEPRSGHGFRLLRFDLSSRGHRARNFAFAFPLKPLLLSSRLPLCFPFLSKSAELRPRVKLDALCLNLICSASRGRQLQSAQIWLDKRDLAPLASSSRLDCRLSHTMCFRMENCRGCCRSDLV